MKKSQMAVLVVVVVVAAFAGWFEWGPRQAPPGQQPLMALTPATLPSFEAHFNAQPQDTRLLLLLSPT